MLTSCPPFRLFSYSSNLVLYAFGLPVSLLSLLTVLRSSVLHPNLKLVLVSQSACFSLFALSRTVQIVLMLWLGPNGWQEFKLVQCAILFSTLFFNLVGHVLLLERLLATLYVRDYEHNRRLWFSLCWLPTIFTFCLLNSLSETYQSSGADSVLRVTPGTLVSIFISLALSFAEIFLVSIMGLYNRNRYHNRRTHLHANNLTERYQLSENIRTAQQLAPSFLFHFFNVLCTGLLCVSMFFRLVSNEEQVLTLMAVLFWLISACNTLIDLSIVGCHPLLRRSALADLAKCCSPWVAIRRCLSHARVHQLDQQRQQGSGKASASASATATNGLRPPPALKCIDGNRLIHSSCPDEHFRALEASWAWKAANRGHP